MRAALVVPAIASLAVTLGLGLSGSAAAADDASSSGASVTWQWDAAAAAWGGWQWDAGSGTWRLAQVVRPAQQARQAYVTGFSWQDNTPAGSPQISHPVVHQTAGGTGTWADPLTLAVGHSLAGGADQLDYSPGTRVYVTAPEGGPGVYTIVEDTCGDGGSPQDGPCHALDQAPAGVSTWVDLWVGGEGQPAAEVDACMSRWSTARQIVVDPRPDLPVRQGPVC